MECLYNDPIPSFRKHPSIESINVTNHMAETRLVHLHLKIHPTMRVLHRCQLRFPAPHQFCLSHPCPLSFTACRAHCADWLSDLFQCRQCHTSSQPNCHSPHHFEPSLPTSRHSHNTCDASHCTLSIPLPIFITPARLSGIRIQVKTPSTSCWAAWSCPSPRFLRSSPSDTLQSNLQATAPELRAPSFNSHVL
jgi:hypothetical protein